MSFDAPGFWLLAAIVGGAFAVEAATGFGATVIAVALGVHLFPLDELLPVLVPLGLVLSATIAWRERTHLDRTLFLRRIVPFMGLGLGVGISLFESASNEALRRSFGAFVMGVSALELWRARKAGGAPAAPLPPAAEGAALIGAGVIHGLFSTGGPLLVYALGRTSIPKRTFRATLSTVWVVMGATLSLAYAWNGHLRPHTLAATGVLVPVVGVAFVIGDHLHHRLDEAFFRALVYSLLLVAGLSSLL